MSPNSPVPQALIPLFLALAALIPGGAALRADTIYSNFGTADAPYATGAGILVGSDGVASSSVAIDFTPTADYTLTSIAFVATDLTPQPLRGEPGGVAIGIFADNGGQPDSVPLESFTAAPAGLFGRGAPVTTVTSLLQPLLQADTRYWIGMNVLGSGFAVWNQNSSAAFGLSQTDGLGNWSASGTEQGVVRIDGTFVPSVIVPDSTQSGDLIASAPEPGAWYLMAVGLAGVLFLIRRPFPSYPPTR